MPGQVLEQHLELFGRFVEAKICGGFDRSANRRESHETQQILSLVRQSVETSSPGLIEALQLIDVSAGDSDGSCAFKKLARKLASEAAFPTCDQDFALIDFVTDLHQRTVREPAPRYSWHRKPGQILFET